MQRGETWDARERTNPDELNAARARLLIADALGQLSAEHRALIGRCLSGPLPLRIRRRPPVLATG